MHGVALQFAFQLFGRAFDDHAAAIHDADALGQAVGFIEVVGGKKDRDSGFAREAGDFLPKVGAGFGIESGGRLIEEKDARLVDQAEGDIELALHASRPGARDEVGGFGQAHGIEEFGDAPIEGGPGHSMKPALQGEVLAAGGFPIDSGFLRDAADGPANLGLGGDDVEPGDGGRAGVRRGERGQDTDGGGFACAIGPEEREDGSGIDGKAQAIESLDATAVGL